MRRSMWRSFIVTRGHYENDGREGMEEEEEEEGEEAKGWSYHFWKHRTCSSCLKCECVVTLNLIDVTRVAQSLPL